MATKKKAKKQTLKSKKSAAKKVAAKKAAKPAGKAAKKKAPRKGATAPVEKKKKKISAKKPIRNTEQYSGAAASLPKRRISRSGDQSGDLQGLTRRESADSESVEELLEEGNAFEAEAVSGVEDADLADEKEVQTHEVPEDDVPEEYLDEE
jgi:hypothetical protein